MPNSTRRWAKERIRQLRDGLPFPLLGVDNGNGGEFISRRLKDWRGLNRIRFTQGHPCRKNGNCFAERKNGGAARKTVYYDRFEGRQMRDALEEACRCLNPLRGYWYPALRLAAKEKQASGRYKKICGKVPQTPCRRPLESPDLAEEYKAELRRRAALFNPVTLKREMDGARARLLKLSAKRGVTGETA